MGFNFGNAITQNLKSLSTGLDQSLGQVGPAIANPKKVLGRGVGKGTLGHWVDQVYGGTFKEIVEGAYDNLPKDKKTAGVSTPTLRASQVDPEGELGALQNIRKEKRGRKAANLSPASGASILTSR